MHLPRPAAPPTDYLADVGRAVAALSGRSPGTSAPATPGAADEVQRAVQDGREVAAELVPCASDPSRCRLHLRALAQGRSQAAIAAKLGPATAARQARLRQQLQGEAARRQHERATLRSSQRAALLGLSLSAPHPTPLAALARVLRGGLQRAQQQQQGGGRAAGGQPSLAAHLRSRNAAVLDQHKAMRKAWREKRCGWAFGVGAARPWHTRHQARPPVAILRPWSSR